MDLRLLLRLLLWLLLAQRYIMAGAQMRQSVAATLNSGLLLLLSLLKMCVEHLLLQDNVCLAHLLLMRGRHLLLEGFRLMYPWSFLLTCRCLLLLGLHLQAQLLHSRLW